MEDKKKFKPDRNHNRMDQAREAVRYYQTKRFLAFYGMPAMALSTVRRECRISGRQALRTGGQRGRYASHWITEVSRAHGRSALSSCSTQRGMECGHYGGGGLGETYFSKDWN